MLLVCEATEVSGPNMRKEAGLHHPPLGLQHPPLVLGTIASHHCNAVGKRFFDKEHYLGFFPLMDQEVKVNINQ